ncbi:hypothetical protein HOLleu_10410 [Holothuria leucospilota]|uniref:Uncharacterized protein n=1 Tax=Holothuria leucospilota TaxID=206669 RepID=A0A9Q1CEV4_HOLLE|nr:hypothetical protein HOLleu_10410 [Holothuria leucospilota]
MADSREEVHDITGNNPYLRILNDFSDYIQILKHSPEVVAFKEKTGLRPAVRILEITIYDTDFQFVHFTWGRGGEISSLEHWGKDVEEFGGTFVPASTSGTGIIYIQLCSLCLKVYISEGWTSSFVLTFYFFIVNILLYRLL